ncbi:polysaccharide deacetylase family protein [Paraburkholderia acidiphila]|uniref:Polysaccharide deacetylase family protein n=1 Tax=Paraburkholderia acidiphila TaxID=2571747 RepID=A0A7Z2G7A9_9BURK|nr:polysaccharide deacetylase [Paraburkholderia acidiphila]QGZ56399.1 polysaccharide deacetylase family protein [Paraburkholderia acidiphila]
MTTVCLTFDFDAVSIWLSTFKQVSPTPISRGEYGVRVGLPRILAMLARRDVKATFFTPAHTARSFPGAVKALVNSGHEIGLHGLVHESPVGLPVDEERDLLKRSAEVLEQVTGVRPVGYRSPAWDLSESTISLLEEMGLQYDSSLMASDFHPYRARKRDELNEDGFVTGTESSIVEFPVAWELDDFPYFQFLSRPINPALRDVDDVYKAWKAEFDCAHEEGGVFTLTCHPEIIGRGPRVKMLEKLIEHMQAQEGVTFATMGDAVKAYR